MTPRLNNRFALATAFAVSLAALSAATPSAERLLPADTLGMVTVPDWDAATAFYRTAAMSQLWAAPEMKPFREKFEAKWKSEYADPLERDLGLKLSDWSDLVHGQVTIGFLQSFAAGKDAPGGWMLLADAKDKQAALAARLAALKKKWVDAGKEERTERVRDVEFTTFLWAPTNKTTVSLGIGSKGATGGVENEMEDLRSQSGAKAKKTQLSFALAGSLLLVGPEPKDFEKVLARLSGGPVPALAEAPEFEANAATLFRNARAFGWVNMKAVSALLLDQAGAGEKENRAANPFAPSPAKMFDAIGLGGLKTIAFNVHDTGDGALVNVFLGAPESGRKGVLRILAVETKDASPPPFVPASATKFSRWRADGGKLWATLEGLLNDLSPQLMGMLQLGLDSIGKDKDPNFDLKKTLVANLGDDIITYEKAPRSGKPADLDSPPSLYLVGSPRPEQLVLALKTAIVMLPVRADTLSDRELLGRKVYKVKMAPERNPGGGGMVERALSFTHGGGYVALTTDDALLEEYLRSVESPGRGLRETAGLGDAAQKIGGLGTGWFGYENQAEAMKALFDAAKQNPALAEKMFTGGTLGTFNSLAGTSGVTGANPATAGKATKNWFDFSLLPPFEQVAKYFHFSVNNATAQPDGISFKTYLPTPPQLKR